MVSLDNTECNHRWYQPCYSSKDNFDNEQMETIDKFNRNAQLNADEFWKVIK
ncbi:hypothetical protein Glove_134g65 [Diversispora epigaea]|uniref:Uncharacterized protein n=1 Tax=Diversispora epigaea TaxID=1348612 RepID=A0A397IX64_9GLOM|nr:hypothetical protein Glove_134g65 [Diversispora epigaea]